MRFLIVDDSSEFRVALGAMLRARWPEAELEDWDPVRRGSPAPRLAEARFSAVLLEARAGGNAAGGDAMRWVQEVRRDPKAPPIVLIADHGDTHAAIQALKAGAADFLRRTGLTPERLVRSLEHALREDEARRAERGETSGTPTAPLQPQQIGKPVKGEPTQVPGYRALRLIGQGGMSQVFLAERVHDGQALVLKVLSQALRGDPTFLQRFVREYKLLASLNAEHVARIYDQGFSGANAYIAMEYLPGGTLAARIQEGLTALESLRIVAQLAKALQAIHAHGIVHRDLKPQNIMFRANGRLVVVDFGLARDLSANTAALTRHGQLMATPRYMSPEQCLGLPADHRSDLYSVGAMLYEMLSGHKLYESEGPAGLIYAHVHGTVPQLPDRLAGYQALLDRLLAKKPEERFQSAAELFATIAV
jgi:FixJ family two-component response regulator